MRNATIANLRDRAEVSAHLGVVGLYLQFLEFGFGGANTLEHLLLVLPLQLELAGLLFQVGHLRINDFNAFFNFLSAGRGSSSGSRSRFDIFLERLLLDLETTYLTVSFLEQRRFILERDAEAARGFVGG